MNNKQRILIVIAVCLIIITGLFPPWRTARLNLPGPYSLLWKPPYSPHGAEIVDTTRLGIEWILIALVSGALFALFRKKEEVRVRGNAGNKKQLQDQLRNMIKDNQQLISQLTETKNQLAQARGKLMDKYEVEQSQLKDIFGY